MSRKRLYTIIGVALTIILLIMSTVLFLNRDKTVLPQNITDIPRPLFTIYGETKQPLNHPLTVAISNSGKIYVADSGNNRVQVFKSNGKYLLSFGKEGKGEGEFNAPYGIAVLPDKSVLVSDMQNHRIQQFSAEGKFQKVFLDSNKGIKPGVLLFEEDQLYVSDLANHQVAVLNLKGEIIKTYKEAMNYPQGLALSKGKLIIADAGNNVLRLLGTAGEGSKALNGTEDGKRPFNLLRGVAVDNLGRFLVVDSLASEIRFLNEEGKTLGTIGAPGGEMDKLQYPSGVAIDSRGKLYIADWENNRIQVWGYLAK